MKKTDLRDRRQQFALVPMPLVDALRSGAVSYKAMALYVALDAYRNRLTGKAWPGLRRLSADVKLSIPTVRKLLSELGVAGFITVEHPDDPAKADTYYMEYGPNRQPRPAVETRANNLHAACATSDASACTRAICTQPSEDLREPREDAPGAVAPPAQVPGPAPIAPDIEFLKHADAEFERATGITVVRVWARDRRLSRSIIDRCPGGMVEAKAVATRYARDGKANGWSVTLVGLLGRIDDVRQRIARSGPVRRDDGTVAEHPMARMSRIDREWRAAHSGRTPASADEVSAWARKAGRLILNKNSRLAIATPPRAIRSAPIPPPVMGAR